MPELGTYTGVVLGSYGFGLVLIVALVGQSLWHGARVRAALAEVEARQARGGGGA